MLVFVLCCRDGSVGSRPGVSVAAVRVRAVPCTHRRISGRNSPFCEQCLSMIKSNCFLHFHVEFPDGD
jgi:hypothetical protein